MMPLLLLTELLGSPEIDKGKQMLFNDVPYLQDRQKQLQYEPVTGENAFRVSDQVRLQPTCRTIVYWL